MTIREEIRSNYPKVLSLESIRCILHISKRKAKWMLENGIIKCENNGKKTRQYKVTVDDLLEYLDKLEQGDPSVMTPVGKFNAKQPKGHRPPIIPILMTLPPDDFRLWLEDEWYKEPDLLRISEISRLTGYHENTIQRWIRDKRIRAVWTQQVLISSKTWLIDFYCNDAYQIVQKNDAHTTLMKRYYGIT